MRAPCGESAERFGALDLDPAQAAAVASGPGDEEGLGFEGDRVGNEPPARTQPLPAPVEQTRHGHATADEDRVRIGCALERIGRAAAHRDGGDAEGAGVDGDLSGAGLIMLEGDRTAVRVGARPFDRDTARAAADVPQQLPRRRVRAQRG